MNVFLRCAAVLVLASLAFGAEPAPSPATGSAIVEWDFSGVDLEGNPEQLTSFELSTVAAPTVVVTVPACAASGAMSCQSVLSGLNLTPGVHALHVRAVDLAGNRSDWSENLTVILDPIPPSAPTGCRLLR